MNALRTMEQDALLLVAGEHHHNTQQEQLRSQTNCVWYYTMGNDWKRGTRNKNTYIIIQLLHGYLHYGPYCIRITRTMPFLIAILIIAGCERTHYLQLPQCLAITTVSCYCATPPPPSLHTTGRGVELGEGPSILHLCPISPIQLLTLSVNIEAGYGRWMIYSSCKERGACKQTLCMKFNLKRRSLYLKRGRNSEALQFHISPTVYCNEYISN